MDQFKKRARPSFFQALSRKDAREHAHMAPTALVQCGSATKQSRQGRWDERLWTMLNAGSRTSTRLNSQRVLTKLGNFYESVVTPITTPTYTVLQCSFWRNWRCKNMKLVFRKFLRIFKCWSSIVYHLFRLKRNSKFQLELIFPSSFGWIFKWSKLYQTSPTIISRHNTHFVPNNRTKTLGCYITILHFKNRQKVYL